MWQAAASVIAYGRNAEMLNAFKVGRLCNALYNASYNVITERGENIFVSEYTHFVSVSGFCSVTARCNNGLGVPACTIKNDTRI